MPRSGFGIEDVQAIYRVEYLRAVELTRAANGPATDWDGFVDALWRALVPAFGLDVETDFEGRQEP